MCWKPATGKIPMNNYRHGSCRPSLTGKTMSVSVIFTQGTHRNVKDRSVTRTQDTKDNLPTKDGRRCPYR